MTTILEIVPKFVFYDPKACYLAEEKEYVENKMAEAFMNNCNPIFTMINGEKVEIVTNLIESYKVSEL